MEGTVTIPVEEYNRMRDTNKFIENEEIFRVKKNLCRGHVTYYKLSVDQFVSEKDEEISELKTSLSIHQKALKEASKEIKFLKELNDSYIENANNPYKKINEALEELNRAEKSFWKRLFS